MKFFWGFVWVVIGTLVIKYSFQITNLFGKIGWAENHLSSGLGGTYTLYKLIGVVIIILAMLYMFGGLGFVLSPLDSVF